MTLPKPHYMILRSRVATEYLLWSNKEVFGLLCDRIYNLEGACWLPPNHGCHISIIVEKTQMPSFLLPSSLPLHVKIQRYTVQDKTY